MTQNELTRIHLSAPARWDMDSADVDQALIDAGLNPADPGDYTSDQAIAACQTYKQKIGVAPYPLRTSF